MILLRICALFALLLPVSFLAMILMTGDESIYVVNFTSFTGLLGAEVTAIATILFAWKRRNDPERPWPDRWTTIAAALSIPVPWVAIRMLFRSFDGPKRPWFGMIVFLPVVFVAVRLLTARGGKEAHASNAELKPSRAGRPS